VSTNFLLGAVQLLILLSAFGARPRGLAGGSCEERVGAGADCRPGVDGAQRGRRHGRRPTGAVACANGVASRSGGGKSRPEATRGGGDPGDGRQGMLYSIGVSSELTISLSALVAPRATRHASSYASGTSRRARGAARRTSHARCRIWRSELSERRGRVQPGRGRRSRRRSST
jgi:hypothetical protein